MTVSNNNYHNFDYFYGEETLQFAFYRVPKILITDPSFKDLSNDAKLLYGLLLERSTLSQKNGWLSDNKVYIIFTIENIMEAMNVGRAKAVKILKELTEYGLVDKKRIGQGKPTLLFLKSCFKPINPKKFQNRTSKSFKTENLEVPISDFQKSDNETSINFKNETLKVSNSESNNNYYNNTEYNNTNLSIREKMDGYIKIIQKNIEYSPTRYFDKREQELFDELYNIICDIVCIEGRDVVRINGADYPISVVRSIYLKLNSGHIEYVMTSMKENRTEIKNIRNYLISSLYNSYFTIGHYYQQSD